MAGGINVGKVFPQFSGQEKAGMGNNFEQYEALLGNASETTAACLNTEGGAFLLAWVGELIQNLVAEN